MRFRLSQRLVLVLWIAVSNAACGEKAEKPDPNTTPETAPSRETNAEKGAGEARMISALVPIPPSFMIFPRKTIGEFFVDATGHQLVPGSRVEALVYEGSIFVHHYPEAVERFHQYLTSEDLFLAPENAYRKHTKLVIDLRCLRIVRDEGGISGKITLATGLTAGEPMSLARADFRFKEVDHEFQSMNEELEDVRDGLRNVQLSAGLIDPDFFADSCLVGLSYLVAESPGVQLHCKTHFVPGEEKLIYIGEGYVAAVTVYLISDFPIPTRAEWEKAHSTRLDDYDRGWMVFSFAEGRAIRFRGVRDGQFSRKSWDFLYEPNRLGLAAFHPDAVMYASAKPDEEPETDGDQPTGDTGGICDLGDVPLATAAVPEDAEFLPVIPKPQRDHTYAIRNRHGDLAGFIRIESVNFSKGNASSLHFFWRRVEGGSE